MGIVRILNKLLYPYTYSSDAYINYIRKRGGGSWKELLYFRTQVCEY